MGVDVGNDRPDRAVGTALCGERGGRRVQRDLPVPRNFCPRRPEVRRAARSQSVEVQTARHRSQLRPDGRTELYVVNHGGNESVEVFDVDLDAPRPSLKWIGGVRLPGSTAGNDVAAVDNGFVVSTTGDPEGRSEVSVEQAIAGADTGGVLEWSPSGGWTTLPRTQINTANGVAVSPDGEWVYIGGWNSRCLRKVRRGGAEPDPVTVDVSIMVDNLTWSASGLLLAAGTYGSTMQEFLEGHFG